MPEEKEPCEFATTDCVEPVTSYGKVEEDGSYTKPPILGYRNMTANELALFNEGKALAVTVGNWFKKLNAMPKGVPDSETPVDDTLDPRWLSIGRTHMQEGFMATLRSIAKPTTF